MSTDPVPMSEREREARKYLTGCEAGQRLGYHIAIHLRATLDECADLRQKLADARAALEAVCGAGDRLGEHAPFSLRAAITNARSLK